MLIAEMLRGGTDRVGVLLDRVITNDDDVTRRIRRLGAADMLAASGIAPNLVGQQAKDGDPDNVLTRHGDHMSTIQTVRRFGRSSVDDDCSMFGENDGGRPRTRDPLINPSMAAEWAPRYVGEHDPRLPGISPARGDMAGLSPKIPRLFGLVAVPGQSAYNAAKFAICGFTEALRQEMLSPGIR